jgi:ribosome biogenesis GTPase
MVIKSTGSSYRVRLEDGTVVDASLRGNIRLQGLRSTNPVAVGDFVFLHSDDRTGSPQIVEILDRRNYLIRKSSNLSRQIQIIAANLDQVALVVTLLMPETKPEFIDRFLASAEAYRIPVILVFNKTDLLGPEGEELLQIYQEVYALADYPCIPVSATQGLGMKELRNHFLGKVTLVSGNSGVGKSTILNDLIPGLELRTGKISDYHQKGKHTTTFAEAFELDGGGFIIDTPGIKGFGSFDIGKNELFHFFREIFRYAADCRFHNCTHTHEPGCAVLQAVELGKIGQSRYRSYLSMYYEEEGKYRRD